MNDRITMKRSLIIAALFAGLILGVSPRAHAAPVSSHGVVIDGSSTVFPISEAVAEEFQRANSTINVTVGVSGTGGGFKKFRG